MKIYYARSTHSITSTKWTETTWTQYSGIQATDCCWVLSNIPRPFHRPSLSALSKRITCAEGDLTERTSRSIVRHQDVYFQYIMTRWEYKYNENGARIRRLNRRKQDTFVLFPDPAYCSSLHQATERPLPLCSSLNRKAISLYSRYEGFGW